MKQRVQSFVILTFFLALGTAVKLAQADESFHGRQYIHCGGMQKGISEPLNAPSYDLSKMEFMAECTAPHGDRFLRYYVDLETQAETFLIYDLETGRLVDKVVAMQSACLHNSNGSSTCTATNSKQVQIFPNSTAMIILWSN